MKIIFLNRALGTSELHCHPGPNKVTPTWAAPADNGRANILSYRIFPSHSGGAYTQIGSDVPAGKLSYGDRIQEAA